MRERFAGREQIMRNTSAESIDLTDEELDAIAGGSLDEDAKAFIDDHLKLWKQRGFDKNKVRRIVFGNVDRTSMRGALDYLNRVW